jgi:Skp family chaperone for outer membrane proteins
MPDGYQCTLDSDGWQLYSDEDGETASADAAKKLSAELTFNVTEAKRALRDEPCLSERKLAQKVQRKMSKLMEQFAKQGACDTEPSCVLVAELERAFGLDPYSLERW